MAFADMAFLPVGHPRAAHHMRRLKRHWRNAIRIMAWLGCNLKQAAEQAGVSELGLQQLIETPGGKQAYLRAVEEFRTGQIASSIHRLVWIRDNSDNHMAVIHAIKLLREPVLDQNMSKQTMPGVVIQVMDTQTTDNSKTIQGQADHDHAGQDHTG